MESRGRERCVIFRGENTVTNQGAGGRQTQQEESNAGRTVRKA